jgi:hypothetical protein
MKYLIIYLTEGQRKPISKKKLTYFFLFFKEFVTILYPLKYIYLLKVFMEPKKLTFKMDISIDNIKVNTRKLI